MVTALVSKVRLLPELFFELVVLLPSMGHHDPDLTDSVFDTGSRRSEGLSVRTLDYECDSVSLNVVWGAAV